MRARIFEKQKPVGDESSFFRIRASIIGDFAFQEFYGVPEGRLDCRPALQRRLLTIPNRPVPEGWGEPSGPKMIRMTSFARAKRSIRRFTPALRDGGYLFVF